MVNVSPERFLQVPASSTFHELVHIGRCFQKNKINDYRIKGGEGNGTPLQYSCLENPMDGGVW